MTTQDILADIAVREFHCTPEKLVTGASIEELGLDSLGLMEFIFRVEEIFNIRIDNDQAEKITTLEDLVQLVDSLQKPLSA